MSEQKLTLEQYPMMFKISLAERVRAAAGVPAHIRRKRRIEDLEEAIILALADIYDEAETQFGAGTPEADGAFAVRANELDIKLLNDLIERHNQYYPIEANLPIEVSTGKLIAGQEPWVPLKPATHESLMTRLRALRAEASRPQEQAGDPESRTR